MQVVQVEWDDARAVAARARMDGEMSVVYADRTIDATALVVDPSTVVWTGLAIVDGDVAGHAALRTLHGVVELKRLVVDPASRGRGVAAALLDAAHARARQLGHHRVLLQTGDRQPAAVRLYERAGYVPVPIYPPYESITFSRCMALDLG